MKDRLNLVGIGTIIKLNLTGYKNPKLGDILIIWHAADSPHFSAAYSQKDFNVLQRWWFSDLSKLKQTLKLDGNTENLIKLLGK